MTNWKSLVALLELTGAAKELVDVATLTGFEGNIYIRLEVTPAHKILVTPTVINKIAASLQNALLMQVQLEVELREENAVVMGYNINRQEKLQ